MGTSAGKASADHLAATSPIEAMEARLVEDLPDGPGWQFEPKWDGFRCIAERTGGRVELHAKSGKPLGRYFPEIVDLVRALPGGDLLLDGELAIPAGGTLSFDALQMRLHPAESRVRRLSAETPALLILFDVLSVAGGEALAAAPLRVRRAALERFYAEAAASAPRLRLSPFTLDPAEARRWLDGVGGALDGIVAKRLDDPYLAGERAMLKVKRLRSADCVVGGLRYATAGVDIASLLLGLYDDNGALDHVGFTSSFAAADRPALTAKLDPFRGGTGFTGRAPGGPSRWATARSADWQPLRPELVVEVRYDQVTGNRFRHGTTFLRWRPDKAPYQCTFDQFQSEARPSVVAALIGA